MIVLDIRMIQIQNPDYAPIELNKIRYLAGFIRVDFLVVSNYNFPRVSDLIITQ